MNEQTQSSLTDLLLDPTVVHAALNRAFQEAVRKHAQAGLPMATWQDGKVVWITAEEIFARLRREAST
jgi:hypothetical protein